jgi:Bacterial Ig-like domain (group 3)/FG-GAP-like repeat/FG-GAP repeat
MPPKVAPPVRICKLVALFLLALTLLPARAVAQQSGTRQSTAKPAALAPLNPSNPSSAEISLLSEGSGNTHAGRANRSSSHAAISQTAAPRPLFLPGVTYSAGDSHTSGVAIGDVNGDGIPDVLTAGLYTVDVLLGNADDTLQPVVTYPAGYDQKYLVVTDLRGDGKLDVVAVGSNGDSPCGPIVLLGNGDGTFQPAVFYSGGQECSSVAVADVNGDGKPDIVISSWLGGNGEDGSVTVLLGNGDGTFHEPMIYDSGGGITNTVAIADVNGDGNPDLIVANPCASFFDCSGLSTIAVLLGDGTFQPAVNYGTGGHGETDSNAGAGTLAVADVNADGKLDVVVANTSTNNVAVLLGNGDGTFQAAVNYATGNPGPSGIVIADTNGDGIPDLLVSNQGGSVGILEGNGDGTFQTATAVPANGGFSDTLAASDLNGDGKLDLVVANQETGTVSVLLNDTGSAPPSTALSSSPNPSGFGQSVTLIAAVTSPLGVPTGTVNFFDGATLLGSGNLASGSAALSVSSLVAGSHSMTAAYQGSGSFYASNSALVSQTVNLATTSTVVASLADPGPLSKPISFVATVTSEYGGQATGSATFSADSEPLGTVSVYGWGELTTSFSADGAYSISATYSGDANHSGSTSPLITQYVDSLLSRTTLAASPSPSLVGQPVTLTATVKSVSKHATVPNGEVVTFYDVSGALGTGTTAGGVATFTTSSLPYGNQTVKAVYSGDAVLLSSTGTAKELVERYSTMTAVTSSLNPANYGQAVTFTATVTSAGLDIPTGKVTFKDGGVSLGTEKLSGGVATLTKNKLAVGPHSITAVYTGDGESGESTSPVLMQTVN